VRNACGVWPLLTRLDAALHAARCTLIAIPRAPQVGDRVASINGTPTENVDCDKAVELINTSNEAHLGLVRQKRLAPKADIISSRGSLALAIPPRLLMSRLSKLQVERAAEESKQAKAGFVDDDDAPQSTDLSFAQSIASIISTAGL